MTKICATIINMPDKLQLNCRKDSLKDKDEKFIPLHIPFTTLIGTKAAWIVLLLLVLRFLQSSECAGTFWCGMRCTLRRNKYAGCSLSGQSCWCYKYFPSFPSGCARAGKGPSLSFLWGWGDFSSERMCWQAGTGILHLAVPTAGCGMIHGASGENGIFLKKT